MFFQLLVMIVPCMLVGSMRIPGHAQTTFKDDNMRDIENALKVINHVDDLLGLSFSATLSDVTLHYGDKHLSYHNGSLVLSDSPQVTIWQIAYDKHAHRKDEKASVCAVLPEQMQQCWENEQGIARVGKDKRYRYTAARMNQDFVFMEGKRCLTLGDGGLLRWSASSQCLGFVSKPNASKFMSATRGITVDEVPALLGLDGPIEAYGHGNLFVSLIGNTIGTIANAVAPESDFAMATKHDGCCWGCDGGCGL